MVEILADLLEILSDILSTDLSYKAGSYFDRSSSKFAQQGFDEKFLSRVKLKLEIYRKRGLRLFSRKKIGAKNILMAAKFKFRA